MKNKLLLPISIILVTIFLAFPNGNFNKFNKKTEISKKQRIEDAFEENFRRIKDVNTGEISQGFLIEAIKQTKKMQRAFANSVTRGDITSPRWIERGPNNVGGRTRTIMIDKNDTERKTVWAGGVSGGLWKTEDITAVNPHWEIASDYMSNLSVGGLDQDPNNPQIMYLATGEDHSVYGIGVFKSIDGGSSWQYLPETDSWQFRVAHDVLVHPSGDVYVATNSALFRSQNGGDSWENVKSGKFYDIVFSSDNIIYASSSTDIFSSTTGNSGDWTNITQSDSGFPSGVSRVEFDVSKTEPNVIFAAVNQSGDPVVYKSQNGGTTWLEKPVGGSFYAQTWYDLEIAIDPFNAGHIAIGGVPVFASNNGGGTWHRFAFDMHVDQHKIVFDQENQGVIYFGNDGGIWRSDNGTANSVEDKNIGYNTSQFYACALYPEALSNYMLGGTQDNNSLLLNDFDIANAVRVLGGDGFYCHIDQNEPNIQMVSSQYGNYALTTDGANFSGGQSLNGSFYTPTDYDNNANILYAQTNDGDFYRWEINTNILTLVFISNYSMSGYPNAISTVAVDPNTPNRVYFGTYSGDIIRIDDAHIGESVSGQLIYNGSSTISSIDIENGNANHILITHSNTGVGQNVKESIDGGETWIGVSDAPNTLPDMPVRWGIFNPKNSKQALIATETGVWATELLNGLNTVWIPPMAEDGIALVRTDMLQIRSSDNVVLAATHGRGLWTTDVFSDPIARIVVDRVHYVNSPLLFYGSASQGADSWYWDFGDGGTSTEGDVTHTYSDAGEYNVSLIVNDTLTDYATVKVIDNGVIPYTPDIETYGGDFEGNTDQYGVYTLSGSSFERGNSTLSGKNGTHSGENAFVLGLNEDYYQPRTNARLYLPNFNLSESGIYEFSFWAKHKIQHGLDGFLVEYSLDKGQSWTLLGTEDDEWYNYTNDLEGAAFPFGISYFTETEHQFTKYHTNISYLAGQENVAFRFVFKSDASGNHPGVVIDDVEIIKYTEELGTRVTSQTGEFSSPTEITVHWTTYPEYFCKKFILESSETGNVFEEEESFWATGNTTLEPQNYTYTMRAYKDVYFFRIKVINEASGYSNNFTTPVFIVSRDVENLSVYNISPNPFDAQIGLTFTEIIDQPVRIELFDATGKFIREETITPDAVFYGFDAGDLSTGVYFMRVKIGEKDSKTFRVMKWKE